MYTNKDVYVGQVHKNTKHGKGTYLYANGDEFTGDWSFDKK